MDLRDAWVDWDELHDEGSNNISIERRSGRMVIRRHAY